jgi:hypothetical protein|tara:strand:- start:2369 stop:2632 length:264 start_codon:yes stop_codon:yes gene_type:complete
MKWLIVVVFANLSPLGEKEMYIFTAPQFDDQYECQSDISNPEVIPLLAKKVLEENGPRPIERVLCLPEKSVNEFIKDHNKRKRGTSA